LVQSLLDHKLLIITGKGGVGKTTMAATIGLLAAEAGRRTIIVEVGEQSRMAELFDVPTPAAGDETKLGRNLSSISIDPDRALLEWLQALGGRVSGRLLASSGTFQYFAAAAPGAKELVSMVKIWQLTRAGRGRPRHDLVVVDGPATGHALGMLGSPQTFGAIARVGPIAGQTRHVEELLKDPARTAYVAVALATEMAVTEALELQEGLERQLGRELVAVIVNGLLPRRFSPAEMTQLATLEQSSVSRDQARASKMSATEARAVVAAAARAARAVHERSRFQHNQLARLRRRSFEVLGLPFLWGEGIDIEGVRHLAHQLDRKL
jgi:anion-transporting  ArsA/GET3 family ATPase